MTFKHAGVLFSMFSLEQSVEGGDVAWLVDLMIIGLTLSLISVWQT